MTGKTVKVTTDYREKQLQRALLQFSKPENANLVREALKLAGREDLIGSSEGCLVRPAFAQGRNNKYEKPHQSSKRPAKHSHSRKNDTMPKRNKTVGASDSARRSKSSKLERTFGQDAMRIRREADRLSNGGRKPSKKKK